MNKPYIAKKSELGPSALNPKSIWNAKYLSLVSALNRGDHPDNVKQALFDWLSEKSFSPQQVEKLLNVEPDMAIKIIVNKMGTGLDLNRLPKQFIDTLRRTLTFIGKDFRQRRGHEIGKEIAQMRTMKRNYTPEALAAKLLQT